LLHIGITLASFKESGTISQVNDKLKIYANGPLISVMISFILGLCVMSSTPGDLLLLKLIKTVCVSKMR